MQRLIHGLQFELQPAADNGGACQLIVWSTRSGPPRNVINQPGSAKLRIVGLRSADTIYHQPPPRRLGGETLLNDQFRLSVIF